MSETQQVESREQIEARVSKSVRRSHTSVVPVDGTYAFAITGERLMSKDNLSQGDKNGHGEGCRQIAVQVAPLEDPTDAGSARNDMEQTIWVTLAVPNTDIPNHKVSDKALSDMTRELVSLSDGRVPFVNKKNEDGTWNNSEETKVETISQQVEATLLANEIIGAAKGVKKLAGNIFYASTTRKTGAKGGYFINGRSTIEPKKLNKLVEFEAEEKDEGPSDADVPF